MKFSCAPESMSAVMEVMVLLLEISMGRNLKEWSQGLGMFTTLIEDCGGEGMAILVVVLMGSHSKNLRTYGIHCLIDLWGWSEVDSLLSVPYSLS